MSSTTAANITLENMHDAPTFSEFKDVIAANAIMPREGIERYDKFKRIPNLDPYNTITTTKEYIFFTKPDLHIFDGTVLNPQLSQVPLFVEASKPNRYGDVLRQLQISSYSSSGKPKSPFMNLLSNAVTSSLDIPGIDAEDIATAANINGTKMTYRLTSYTSDNDYSFGLEFEDTKYLEVYMLFKLFDEYERLKHQGRVSPDQKYIINKILHDQISIYKFIVDSDGESIIFFAKMYGCYPKDVPRDSFSTMDSGGGLKFTVNWKCQFVEDMDPLILSDFNHLVSPYMSGRSRLPLYNTQKHLPEHRWAGIPYIEAAPEGDFGSGIIARPKLKWLL